MKPLSTILQLLDAFHKAKLVISKSHKGGLVLLQDLKGVNGID
jgi:hypothetical protein